MSAGHHEVEVEEDPDTGDMVTNALPFPLIWVPERTLEACLPDGWTRDQFGPHIRQVQEALLKGDPSLIKVPEGLTADELVKGVHDVTIYGQAGVPAIAERQKIADLHREALRIYGLEVLFRANIVLDEDHRIIQGLFWCWALQDMGFAGPIPVKIRKNAHPYAGLHYIQSLLKKYQSSRTDLDYEAAQNLLAEATEEEKALLSKLGHIPTREVIELRGSRATMKRLAALIAKQVGYGSTLDPGQLLFVEALREKITASRMAFREEKSDPQGAKKLKQHLAEEAKAISAGGKQIKKHGKWTHLGDGLHEHWALPNYRFRVVEEPVESKPDDAQGAANNERSPYLMEASQFVDFAKAHFNLGPDDAARLYLRDDSDTFNRRLRRYISESGSFYTGTKRKRALDGSRTPRRMALDNQQRRLESWNSVFEE